MIQINSSCLRLVLQIVCNLTEVLDTAFYSHVWTTLPGSNLITSLTAGAGSTWPWKNWIYLLIHRKQPLWYTGIKRAASSFYVSTAIIQCWDTVILRMSLPSDIACSLFICLEICHGTVPVAEGLPHHVVVALGNLPGLVQVGERCDYISQSA